MKRQRTTIEIFYWIFSNASLVCTVARFGGITLFLVIRINRSGRAISRMSSHFLFISITLTVNRDKYCGNRRLFSSRKWKTNKLSNKRIENNVKSIRQTSTKPIICEQLHDYFGSSMIMINVNLNHADVILVSLLSLSAQHFVWNFSFVFVISIARCLHWTWRHTYDNE